MNYKDIISKLIIECGGTIENKMFITEPGCKIINKTEPTSFTKNLFPIFGVNNDHDYENIGEFNARICYLSFKSENSNSGVINDKLIDLGHLSIYNDIHVTFLVAGVSDEVLKEFTAHTEAKISRLTSSKTKAASNTLYRIFGTTDEIDSQKQFIFSFLNLRHDYKKAIGSTASIEIQNMFNLGMKATAFTFSMSIKDYHKLFIGRMPDPGNESDIRLICRKMCNALHELYPKVIRDVDYYLGAGNNAKYEFK